MVVTLSAAHREVQECGQVVELVGKVCLSVWCASTPVLVREGHQRQGVGLVRVFPSSVM